MMRARPDPMPLALADHTAVVLGEWAVSDELNQRVGCGLLTALTLPLWFLLLGLAVASNLALVVAASLFVLSAPVGPAMVRRSRRLPRTIRLESARGPDTELVLISRSGQLRRPLADLRRLDVGTSVGPWPIRLDFADGTRLRLPADLVDIGTLLEEFRSRCPQLVMTGLDRLDQHNGQFPTGQGPGDGDESGADLSQGNEAQAQDGSDGEPGR